jgi:thioredoxin-related protein
MNVFAVMGCLALACVAHSEVVTEFSLLLKRSESEKKPVMLYFADTNSWCRKFKSEALDRPEVQTFLSNSVLRYDCLMTGEGGGGDEARQLNQRLITKYEVEEFPTVVLIRSNQHLIGKFGYIPGGAKPFLAEMNRLLARKDQPPATQPAKVTTANKAEHFQLRLSALGGKPLLATINGHPLAVGESMSVKAASGKRVKVKCLEIRQQSVVVEVEGELSNVELELGKPRSF